MAEFDRDPDAGYIPSRYDQDRQLRDVQRELRNRGPYPSEEEIDARNHLAAKEGLAMALRHGEFVPEWVQSMLQVDAYGRRSPRREEYFGDQFDGEGDPLTRYDLYGRLPLHDEEVV